MSMLNTKSDIYAKGAKAVAKYICSVGDMPELEYAPLSGWGPIRALEDKIRNYYGGGVHVLCVDSATNALLYLLMAIERTNGDVVATTPLSFGATISGALCLGSQFVFTDLDQDEINIDPKSLRKLLEKHNVKAVIAVDFCGIPHDMPEIQRLCDENDVWYFSDSSQAFSAKINGQNAGVMADASVISFSPGKAVSAFGGAAIITGNNDLYERLISISQHPNRMMLQGFDLTHEMSLNGRINQLAAVFASSVYDDLLAFQYAQQQKGMALYSRLDANPYIHHFNFKKRNMLPSFYSCPLRALDEKAFDDKLREQLLLYRPAVDLLPDQLFRLGQQNKILEWDDEEGTRQSLEQLFYVTYTPFMLE